MTLVAIDPGTHGYGVAIFKASKLSSAFLIGRGPEFRSFFYGQKVSRVVIEKPQIYFKRTVDSNDLIEVALAAGEAGGFLDTRCLMVSYIYPASWKNQLPKRISEKRTRDELSAAERRVVALPTAEKTLAHNVWDAIGIGLHALGRSHRSPGVMSRKAAAP